MCQAVSELEKRIRKAGRREGRREGIKQGIQQGERTNAIHNARMFFRNGASLELVAASIVTLSREEINKIYEEEIKLIKA